MHAFSPLARNNRRRCRAIGVRRLESWPKFSGGQIASRSRYRKERLVLLLADELGVIDRYRAHFLDASQKSLVKMRVGGRQQVLPLSEMPVTGRPCRRTAGAFPRAGRSIFIRVTGSRCGPCAERWLDCWESTEG